MGKAVTAINCKCSEKGLCFYLLGTCWNGSNAGKMMSRKVARWLFNRVCDKQVLFDGYLMEL